MVREIKVETNSNYGKVNDVVIITVTINDGDHKGNYVFNWKEDNKELKLEKDESQTDANTYVYKYKISAGVHEIYLELEDQDDNGFSWNLDKAIKITGFAIIDQEPKAGVEVKRTKYWKLKTSEVDEGTKVYWYKDLVFTGAEGEALTLTEALALEGVKPLKTHTAKKKTSFTYTYKPENAEPHKIYAVMVPKGVKRGAEGTIYDEVTLDAEPLEVKDIEYDNKIFEGLYTDGDSDTLTVSFTEQAAEGKYTVAATALPEGAKEPSVNGTSIEFPRNVEGEYNFTVKYTVDENGLDAAAYPASKSIEILYTVKKKVNVRLAEGATITKNSDGDCSVKNVTTDMFVVDDINIKLTAVNIKNWKYKTAYPGNNKSISGIKSEDFTFENNSFYEAIVPTIKGSIKVNTATNSTIDLTQPGSDLAGYKLEVADGFLTNYKIVIKGKYKNLLNDQGWFKNRLTDGQVIDIESTTEGIKASFVKEAKKDAEKYSFENLKEGTNTYNNIYVERVSTYDSSKVAPSYSGPFTLIFNYDSKLPTYEGVEIIKKENKFFGLITLEKEAEFGDDFTTTDDGAVIVTNDTVTFSLKGAKDDGSGLKIAGIYASKEKLKNIDGVDDENFKQEVTLGKEDGKYYLYLKLEDNAGNVMRQALNGAVLTDKTAPTATISFTPDAIDAEEHKAVLNIEAKDDTSGISRISAVLYDGTGDDITAYQAEGNSVTVETTYEKDLKSNEFFNHDKVTTKVEDWNWKVTYKGAQLSILIAISDWAGNTVYYDQTGSRIDPAGTTVGDDQAEEGNLPADYKAAETAFKESRTLGENTFIIYGAPQVTVETDEKTPVIDREVEAEGNEITDYIFTDLTKITVSFTDLFSGDVSLSFNPKQGVEEAGIPLDFHYNTETHAYVCESVTLLPVYGSNTIELTVPAGTKVQLNDDNVGQDQVGWFAKDADTDTYKGSFIFDNVAPVITININDEEANKEEEILYFGLANGVDGESKKPVITATITEDYFYNQDKPILVITDTDNKLITGEDGNLITDENGEYLYKTNNWIEGVIDDNSGSGTGETAENEEQYKKYTATLELNTKGFEIADGKYKAQVVASENLEQYYNYQTKKALVASYDIDGEHDYTIVIDTIRPVITWFMTGSKNIYEEADYFKDSFTTLFVYDEENGNAPVVTQKPVKSENDEDQAKKCEEQLSLTIDSDGIYQFKISGGVDKAGNHPVYVVHLADEKEETSAIEVKTLAELQGKVNEVNSEIASRNEEGKKAAEEAGEEFEPEALFTIDSYLNSLGTGLSQQDIEAVETANNNADKPDTADESEAAEEPEGTDETERTKFTLTSKVKVLDTTAPTAEFVVTGSGKHYENDGDYYKDAFEVTFTVEDVNYDLKKVTARTLFNKNSDPKNETGTVISAGEAADGEEQPNTETETHTYSHTVEKNSESEGYYRFTIEGEDKAGNKLVTPSESGSNNAEGTFTSGMKVLDITNPTFYIATLPDPKSAENIEGETVYYGVNTGLKTLTAGFKVFEKNYHKDLIWTGYTDPIKEGKYRDANPVLEKAKNNKAAPSYDPELKIATYNSTIEFNDNNNGVYRFVIAGKDKAGNKLIKDSRFQETAYTKTIECDLEDEEAAYCTYNKVIDTKAPTGTVTIGNYYNATLSAGKLSVIKAEPYRKEKSASGTITVNTTELSPVRIDYPLTSTVSGLSQKNAKDYSYDPATFSTSGEQVFYLDVTLTDRAGNTTNAQRTNKIYLDVTAPTEDELAPIISISATANSDAHGPSGNPLFASGVPFHIVVSDPYAPTGANEQNSRSSGLDFVTYEFKVGNQSQGVHPLKTADAEANNRTGSYKDLSLTYVIDTREVVAPAEYNNNDILLIVTATDHSGNTSNREYKFGIDVTAPKIAVSYDNNAAQNGKYFKDPRTATITVTERNFDPNAITVTTNGGSQSGWSYMNYGGNGDNDTWTKTINYSTDGDYTISASGQDLLGNRQNEATVYNGTAPQDFTIDRTAPVITVSFDNNNSYKDSKYYNSDRTATVQIVEHNFNAADARTETTAAIARGDAPSVNVGGWSSSGDNRYQSLGFTQDGDYTITVNYTDMAGNPAAEVKVDEFTVDKTAPEIKFDNTTVQNGVAYNGVIAPRVTFSDTNYDPSGVTFVMTGLKDSRGKNLVVQEVMNDGSGFGGSVSYSDFARIKANDDIYTATGKIIDRAGNESSVSITFSVNRFGSTFDFNNDEVTHDIVNRYYINDPKNVVLREINVNDVIERKVYMTHGTENIELVEGEDYRLTEDMNGGWKQYVYEFFADNFEEEGLYNVIVQTKDNAGNENSNTYEYINENGEKVAPYRLTFLVDKTEPYSEFEGVNTRQTRYYEDALNLMVGITDNVAVARVQIYVDNELVIDLFDTEEDDALSRTLRENNNSVPLTISSKAAPQTIKVITTDAATNTSLENEWTVVVTRNILAQYFYNRPLFFGSLIGVALLILLLILWKRRKDEEKKKKTA